MAVTGNGTSDYVKTSSAITAPSRWSFHLHYKNATAPGTGANRRVFTLSDVGVSYDSAIFVWHHTTDPKTVFQKRSTGTYDSVQIPTALAANTWYRIGGRYDGTNLAAFLNGAKVAQTASADPSATAPVASLFAGTAATADFDNGTGAEVALWNVALTDAEFAALGAGVSPLLIRPQSLVLYWPLIRDMVQYVGPAITTTSPTVAEHPPLVAYASDEQIARWDSAATYVWVGSGGITMGGSATATTAYTWTGSGGIVMGGAAVVMSETSFSTTVTFTSTEDQPPQFSNTLTLTSSFVLGDFFISQFTNTLNFQSRFSADVGALATGRNRG